MKRTTEQLSGSHESSGCNPFFYALVLVGEIEYFLRGENSLYYKNFLQEKTADSVTFSEYDIDKLQKLISQYAKDLQNEDQFRRPIMPNEFIKQHQGTINGLKSTIDDLCKSIQFADALDILRQTELRVANRELPSFFSSLVLQLTGSVYEQWAKVVTGNLQKRHFASAIENYVHAHSFDQTVDLETITNPLKISEILRKMGLDKMANILVNPEDEI